MKSWVKVLVPYFIGMGVLAFLSVNFFLNGNKALGFVCALIFVILCLQLFFGRKMQAAAFELQSRYL